MSWNETSIKETSESCISLYLTWMEAESCKSSCCRRGGMDEDWMTSSKTNMYLGSGLMLGAPSSCSSFVDELSHQTYDHIVAVVAASYFRGADVVAIADVKTQSPLVLGMFQQLPANLARDYREVALVIYKVSGVLELLNHSVVFSPSHSQCPSPSPFPSPFPSPSPPSPSSLPPSCLPLPPSLPPSLPLSTLLPLSSSLLLLLSSSPPLSLYSSLPLLLSPSPPLSISLSPSPSPSPPLPLSTSPPLSLSPSLPLSLPPY